MKYPIRTLSRTGLLAAALLVAVGCGQRLPGDQPAGGAVPTSPGISVPPTVHGSGSPLPSCLGTGCDSPPTGQSGATTPPPAGSSADPTTGAKVLGTQSATGKQASTYTYGTANHPTAIWVKVTASPDQNVYGGWTLVCQKGSEQKPGERNFAGPTPFIQQIPFPVPDPDTCTVAAEAALDGTGTITVTLLVK